MMALKTRAATLGLVALTGAAQAALLDLGNGSVKDTTTNLIWLQNWDASGLKDWSTQMAWAENLVFAGNANWALPSIAETASLSAAYGDFAHGSVFQNVRVSYWSSTEYAQDPNQAWYFFPSAYWQTTAGKSNLRYAVAVSSVPEPQPYAMLLAGLGAVSVALRRRYSTALTGGGRVLLGESGPLMSIKV